ncbi:hypothetical protein NDA12_000517 [Ustilago hordei]|nr:hypothetical protein NDA15_005429 [Ustilago hordei]KAJ1589749.1 hypothetical protein NDA12_000517 [Ustilago hordei]
MRITVWNINGLRTLKGYQPWYRLPDWEACLEHLGADIACFQEIKMTRKQLTEPICILPSYNAFFNFHPSKGYSGTVTYVRKNVSIPLKAEQGITGRLPVTSVSSNPSIPDNPIGCVPTDTHDDVDPQTWNALDEEGRCVVLDLGLFVLFNVYCPNETGPERLKYKMTYYQCLAERAHRLIQSGRQVMIVGDMNIIRDPIDHCDPEQSMKEHGWEHFHQHPARSWFQSFLAPQGKFHDVGRMYHPDRRKMFTCWNTLIDARPANYGVRLDYTLVTEGLLPWIKGADIQADVYGSDHCPVYVDLFDEREVDGKTVKLKDLMHGGVGRLPPALAACHYDEFSGKQRKLASFFGASKKSAPVRKENYGADTAPATQSISSGGASSTDASQIDIKDSMGDAAAPSIPRIGAGSDRKESSLADALFSLPSQQEGISVEVAPGASDPSAGSSSTAAVTQSPSKIESSKIEVAPSAWASSAATAPQPCSPLKAPASQSSPNAKRNGTSPKRSPAVTKGKETSKGKSAASLKGQTSLKGFFAKPTSSSTATPTASSTKTSIDLAEADEPPSQPKSIEITIVTDSHQLEAHPSYSQQGEEEVSNQDLIESATESQAPEESAAKRVGAFLAWGAIFSPTPAPLCRNHSEACRAWTVNKPGPNHGRKFWLCSRPVGPGYEKSGRAKGDVNPEYRCNFFLWDSDLRGKKKGHARNGSGGSGGEEKEGKSFAEVGREREQIKKRGSVEGGGGKEQEREELGGVWGPHKRVKTDS